MQALLARHTVKQAMSSRGVSVPADLTLQQLVDGHILGSGRRCFLVRRGQDNVGLITLHGIKEIPRSDWEKTTVSQAMLPLDRVKRVGPDAELWPTLELMDREGVNQLPVMSNGQVVGMLNREDVITFLRTLQQLGT